MKDVDDDLERIADTLETRLLSIQGVLYSLYDREDEIAANLERIANALEKISDREQ